MSDLDKLADVAYHYAKHYLLGKNDREIMPMFLIQRGQENDIIGTPWKDDDEKRTMVVNVALEIIEKGCDRWSFLSESWFAHSFPGDPETRRPMDRPDRHEGVFCCASDGTTVNLYSWEIFRDSDGRVTELKDVGQGGKEMSSWIADALNRAKKLHDKFPDRSRRLGEAINEAIKETE